MTMSASDAFLERLHSVFAPLGHIRSRRMFGGVGTYCDDRMFLLIADEVIYFKVDPVSIEDFEAAGGEPFLFTDGGKPVAMSYWRVPGADLEHPDACLQWGEAARDAAHRAIKGKRPKKAPAPTKPSSKP